MVVAMGVMTLEVELMVDMVMELMADIVMEVMADMVMEVMADMELERTGRNHVIILKQQWLLKEP